MAEAGNEAESRFERKEDPRIALEKRTIRAMIGIYCRGRHSPGEGICLDCREMFDYACARLDRCPVAGGKTTCAQCSIHCYRPEMRARVKEVMRFAGPRMVYRHPILALRHRWHTLKHRLQNGRKITMATRKIVQIDEEKCDGCGECVPSCAEGAIQIVDGKAKLVSDVYCDGLGACLGTCPQDAITVIEREAPEFDEEAALKHVEKLKTSQPTPAAAQGCPGMAVRNLQQPGLPISGMPQRAGAGAGGDDAQGGSASALGNWPVQLHLVPPGAPFLSDCDLLLVADCVPFAYADFHRRLLRGRPVVIGCPKLDDGQSYVEKLADMLRESSIRSITVAHMEVPCCTGLVRIAEAAIEASGSGVPLEDVTISIRGEVLEG